jgi:hypothetical protein
MPVMTRSLGEEFARGVASKDHDQVRQLLHPHLDFRAMTPGRVWDASGPEDVISALSIWFDDGDIIEAVDVIETDAFADRERVGYRLRVVNGQGQHLVEQQAYLSERDGKIGWLRIMCSGYRPVD